MSVTSWSFSLDGSFAQKSTAFKWNCCILWVDIAWGLQKLGLILESILRWNFFFEKIRLIFDIENWLWKYNFGTFWGPAAMSIHKIQQFHLNAVDFWPKTLLFRTQQVKNSMTWLTSLSFELIVGLKFCRIIISYLLSLHNFKNPNKTIDIHSLNFLLTSNYVPNQCQLDIPHSINFLLTSNYVLNQCQLDI